MFYTWIPCKGNGLPSQSPTRQPLLLQFFQQGKPKHKTNRKPNPSTGKFIEGARAVIPYIKGLSEQYRQTLAKYKVRDFFKGTSTIKSSLMHPKYPIPVAQKTDIIYHWKCPAKQLHSWIHRWNQEVPERKTLRPQESNHQCHHKPPHLHKIPKSKNLKIPQ